MHLHFDFRDNDNDGGSSGWRWMFTVLLPECGHRCPLLPSSSCLPSLSSPSMFSLFYVPHGLTFTWWGCCGLCFWPKPTELAHSFSFCSCVHFCLYGPYWTLFLSINSPRTLRFLTLLLQFYFCLSGPFSNISLQECLLQSWYNPLWSTVFKAPTN